MRRHFAVGLLALFCFCGSSAEADVTVQNVSGDDLKVRCGNTTQSVNRKATVVYSTSATTPEVAVFKDGVKVASGTFKNGLTVQVSESNGSWQISAK